MRGVTTRESSGYDPYDGLRSTLASSVRGKRMRQLVVQLRKRSPFDLARLLGVEPFSMAKALGAYLTAESRQVPAAGQTAVVQQTAADLQHSPQLARGAEGGWGYEFDVQTRWAFYPAGSPNIIATYFVGRGFAEAWAAGCLADGLQQATDSAHFMSTQMHAGGHFTYTLDNERLIHNANLLGAGFVAAMGVITELPELVRQAVQAGGISIAAQGPDGSWPYGVGAGLGWIDNFHTAYNLDGLLQLWLATGDAAISDSLQRGARYWANEFFEADGAPRYYASASPGYPHDIHSAGTAVDVAVRLESWGFETGDVADRVASWTRSNLIAPDGTTWYQRHRFWTDRRHFVRWGDAHWALATSSLELRDRGVRDPFEQVVFETRERRRDS